MTVDTFYRAATRDLLFFTAHVVETVVSTDGVEVVGPVIGIFPSEQAAQSYAQSLHATSRQS